MTITRFELHTQHLLLFVEQDEGVLFNLSNSSLFRLPKISIAFILLIDQGLAKNDIITSLHEKSGVSRQKLTPIYQQVLALMEHKCQTATYAQGQYPELKALSQSATTSQAPANSLTFLIATLRVSISLPSNMTEELLKVLAPVQHQISKVDIVLEVQQEEGVFSLYANQLLVEQCNSSLELMPLIIDRVQVLAFQKSDYRFCFHGAALHYKNLGVLLPGESGAGKSTLSALLADPKHAFFSDEYIVFDKDFSVQILPLPIAVKSGSWQVVGEQYPWLNQATIYQRLDGRQLKYLWPHCLEGSTPGDMTKTVFIFPQYSAAQAKAEVTELSVIETLSLLTASGYQLGFELDASSVEQLIEFIQTTKRLRITYSSAEQIVNLLSSVM